MEVLFASLPHHCFWCFFWSRGPKLCPNRTGNTKFYKNLTRVHAYTRFPLSHVCPGTSRNKGNFSEKFPFSVFPDQLEQNSEVFEVFHTPTYVKVTDQSNIAMFWVKKLISQPTVPAEPPFFEQIILTH